MHARLLMVFAVTLVSACAGQQGKNVCQVGDRCTVSGILEMESLWQASLARKGGCIALAAPENFFRDKSDFNQKKARITGLISTQPNDLPGTFSYSYEIDGMRVNINLCDQVMIVEEIITSSGEVWKKTAKQ
ncbi:hypothetical protein [Tahibacter harae]|uniref:Lipoprotein n=1 Tax=Tahibacter harae TaxID=2963937 RepID=A0ABT1QKS1_9GAMM|nr:hypothetical protein [Tahibacter harae]MCQ4163111.1 hypothetical protein [Tahibacter harae]